MKIETLKKSHLKRNIIIGVVVVAIISTVILNFTRAKYKTTQSIPLVNGTINYSLPDLNIVGLYIDGEEVTELDSSKTYTLDTTQSTCTYKNGSAIDNLTLNYDSTTKAFSITPYTTKGTKCTLYFNEKVSAKDTLLANYPTILTRTDFSTTITNKTTGTIYKSANNSQYDNDGEVYYFAGNPTDNWVKFGGFYWRIIRINGNGSIRMIYQGTSANTTGAGTQIRTSAFNSSRTNNMYVGYMYQSNEVHGLANDSTIKEVLDKWYQDNLKGYANDIDGNSGFCGDRTPYTDSSGTTSGGGTGTTTTYYGPYVRFYGQSNGTPVFGCPTIDLFTTYESSQGNKVLQYPIGLISLDEAWYAGGNSQTNQSYYLYTGKNYYTMSPYWFNNTNEAVMFTIYIGGGIGWGYTSESNFWGVRPVINLKADVTISSGNGTASNPYVIS